MPPSDTEICYALADERTGMLVKSQYGQMYIFHSAAMAYENARAMSFAYVVRVTVTKPKEV